jgi:phosphatidylglycerophosphatase A
MNAKMSAKKQMSAGQRRALLATPAGWLACGFGSGLAPVAQGTFGSLAALLPLLVLPAPWWAIVVGFALFRLFDVWKPWPISWLDRRVKGGMGVMVDDVVAGVFAAVVLTLGLCFLPV